MVKLKNVQAYPINDVPDHLVHECKQVGIELAKLIQDNFADTSPNVMLGAIAFLHASILSFHIVDDPEELSKATKQACVALIKNMENLGKFDIFKDVNPDG